MQSQVGATIEGRAGAAGPQSRGVGAGCEKLPKEGRIWAGS